MTCLKKIQNTEVYGSKFSSRTLTTEGDISEYSFKAVVKNIIQGKILEIPGVKNAGTINFDFSQLETLKKSTYQIEYWGDFGALGNEPFLLEELSIVSAENATNCTNSDNLNFEIKIEEIFIPVNITKAINNFSLDFESLSDEQKAQLKGPKGDAFTYADFTPTQIAELQKPATDKLVELNELAVVLDDYERLRVQNENTRVSSENTRNTNEQSRTNAENNRVTAETSRVSAENTRSTAETSRTNAENTRVSSENNRISAENSRVTAETARVTAENARVTAELERQKNKPLNVKVTTPSSWVTNTLSETEILRIEIPSNSFSASDVLKLAFVHLSKINANSVFQFRGKLSESPTMPSGTTDQIFQWNNAPAGSKFLGLSRNYKIYDGQIWGFPFTENSATDITANTNNALSSKSYNRSVTNYLYLSIQLVNALDQVRFEGIQLTNS